MPAMPWRLARHCPLAVLVVRGLNPPSVVGDLLRIVSDRFPVIVERHVLRQSTLALAVRNQVHEDGSIPLLVHRLTPSTYSLFRSRDPRLHNVSTRTRTRGLFEQLDRTRRLRSGSGAGHASVVRDACARFRGGKIAGHS